MSWKWTSAGSRDILDEDPKALEREFKQEIKQMTVTERRKQHEAARESHTQKNKHACVQPNYGLF